MRSTGNKLGSTVFLMTVFLITQGLATPATPPRIPLYIGKGYDILLGNPLSSEGVDPGFRHEVFDFTFSKGETTEDGKYLLPDGISHRKTTACSFSSQISQYRGTQSYQSELKTKAQIGAGYDGPLVKASFSISNTYEKVHNQTMEENMTITHASATCQSYEMSLNVFKPGNMTQNFWSGVSYSMHQKNWDKFIEQFGTHYTYEIILGGRAVQEIQYSWKSVSEMETLTIDINIAAKASFAKFSSDASFDYHKYENQIKYAETLSQNIHEIYVGGHTPKTGKIIDWQEAVVEHPMPITYRLLPLSELFQFNPNKTVDANAAKASFLHALDQYCVHHKCKEPTPDKPKPPPATVETQNSRQFGLSTGTKFNWQHPHPTMTTRKIHIRSGSEVNNIQIELNDGVQSMVSPQFGGQSGSQQEPWPVPNGQLITQVEVRAGQRVDSLTFITNKGTRSPKYGGNGGTYFMETFPEGYHLIGLFGEQSSTLNSLGFVLGKVVFHNGVQMLEKKTIFLRSE